VFSYEAATYQVTVSLGAAAVTGEEWMTTREIIHLADEKLRLAKLNGRNRVEA
jgi:PleD family two-component response regulator